MKWARLYVTKNEIEANMIRHALGEEKIPCQILNVISSRLFAELSEYSLGVEIIVPQASFLQGEKIINELKNKR